MKLPVKFEYEDRWTLVLGPNPDLIPAEGLAVHVEPGRKDLYIDGTKVGEVRALPELRREKVQVFGTSQALDGWDYPVWGYEFDAVLFLGSDAPTGVLASQVIEDALRRLDADVRQRLRIFDGGPELMSWENAHRLHRDEPYIGCPFCQDQFVLKSDPPKHGRDIHGHLVITPCGLSFLHPMHNNCDGMPRVQV